MNRVVLAIVLAACLVAVGHCLSTVAKKPPLRRKNAQSTGSQYLPFLMKLHLPSGMPKSYAVEPPNYFELVPASEKLDYYNHSYPSPQCNNQNVSAKRMNEYMFQTETLLTHLGLDIYDAAVWTIALSILGQADHAHNYTKNVLVADRTFQFTDIRGDHTCNGVMAWGQCTDPSQSGYCGFCYGDGAVTLTKTNAYFFRYISDYWAIEGTVDVRCPELNHMWIWNDYRPILGENAWAQLTGPAHNAMWRHNNTAMNIPDDDPIFALGIPFLDALETMQVGSTGAIFFAPWNTWFGFSHEAEDVAESFSIENQASTYAGLRSLYNILKNKTNSVHRRHLPRIKRLMVGLQKILLSSWNGQYFRQGGTYNSTTSKLAWHQGRSPDFAVDCQTWVGAALGVAVVDGAFGPLTSYNLWQFVKATAGYYSAGYLYGVGYTNNSYGGQVFSGEWTYGAINWVQVMIAEGGYNSTIVADLQNDVFNMQFGLETDLITRTYIHNSTEKYDSVMYANKRYYIPFGWFANNIPAMCSTAWAVLTDHNYNPFNINSGNYGYTDEFVRSMTEIRPDGAVEIKSHVLQEIEEMERGLRPARLEHSKQHGRAGIN